MRYKHFCDVSHIQKGDKYVITLSSVKKISRLEFVRARPKISHMQKITPGGLLVYSINSVDINIYIYIRVFHFYTFVQFRLALYVSWLQLSI